MSDYPEIERIRAKLTSDEWETLRVAFVVCVDSVVAKRDAEIADLRAKLLAAAERIAAQSELLGQRAETTALITFDQYGEVAK